MTYENIQESIYASFSIVHVCFQQNCSTVILCTCSMVRSQEVLTMSSLVHVKMGTW